MQEFIPVDIFCMQHDISLSFISSLQEFGLIEVITVDEAGYIPVNQLTEAEKLVRLHADLAINMEGIDVVTHLLRRITELQDEMQLLRNRLLFYEAGE